MTSGETVEHDAQGLLGQLSAHLFWDVDRTAVDPERHRAFIIVRTMERGSLDDVMAVWRYYGPDAVREALMQARSLEPRTLFFFANQFGVRPEEFRAFRQDAFSGVGGGR